MLLLFSTSCNAFAVFNLLSRFCCLATCCNGFAVFNLVRLHGVRHVLGQSGPPTPSLAVCTPKVHIGLNVVVVLIVTGVARKFLVVLVLLMGPRSWSFWVPGPEGISVKKKVELPTACWSSCFGGSTCWLVAGGRWLAAAALKLPVTLLLFSTCCHA